MRRTLNEVVALSGKRLFHDIVPLSLLSLAGAAVLVPFLFFLPIGLSLPLLPFAGVPLCAGALAASNLSAPGGSIRIRGLFVGAFRFMLPSLVLAFVGAAFMLIVVSSWWYYGSRSGVLSFALAVFQTYFAGMVLVSQLYALPLVVREKIGPWTAMGRSFRLFLANPLYTIGASAQLVSAAVLLAVTGVGFGFLFFGLYGVYMHQVADNVLASPDSEELKDEKAEPEAEKGKWMMPATGE